MWYFQSIRSNTECSISHTTITRCFAFAYKQEFDHPHLLLKNRESHLSEMLQQTGKSMAEKLAEMAETVFLRSPELRPESNTDTVTTGNST